MTWTEHDKWRAAGKKNFLTTLLLWKAIVFAGLDNWAQQEGVKRAAEDLDWERGDAGSTCKNLYQQARTEIIAVKGA